MPAGCGLPRLRPGLGLLLTLHLHRLRQKVDRGFAYALIHTIAGAGYMIREPEASESS